MGNPAKREPYNGLQRADDPSDARWLSEPLRLGVFPASNIYPKEIRGVRDALRRGQLFVRQRIQSRLSLEGLLARYGLDVPSSYDLMHKWTERSIAATNLPPFVQLQLQTLLDSLRGSDRLTGKMGKSVRQFVQPTEAFDRVRPVPGMGTVLGTTLALESGEFSRFANAGRYASCCRTVDSRRDSNGKKKGENNRLNGNRYLAWAFIEAATFAICYEPKIQAWDDRKKWQRNSMVARKALACKLAQAVWHVRQGKDFDMRMLLG